MKIALIADIKEDVFSGPRNSVTLLASGINTYTTHAAEVFSLPASKGFKYNKIAISPLLNFKQLRNFDVVVLAGFFKPRHLLLSLYLRVLDIPYVISPRSSLVKESFSRSKIRKIAFMAAGGWLYVKLSSAVHFLTADEKKNSFAIQSNAFVVPNISTFAAQKAHSSQNEGRIVAFLGRYDIMHKGLDRLLSAVSADQDSYRAHHVKFVLAGPDFRGGREALENLANQLEIDDLVDFRGPLQGADKEVFLSSCDIFVHTSRFEGQPQAVIEAMACGVPVAVTNGTNMCTIVAESNCGICLPENPEKLARSMRDFILSPAERLEQLGISAANCSQERFSSESVARSFVSNLLQATVSRG